MANDTRATLWLRWPDEDRGPLWLGVHLNQRGGESTLVGLELWTEAPGEARQSLGPAADPADDLLPWPATALRARDLRRLAVRPIRDRLLAALDSSEPSDLLAAVAAGLRPQAPGRPRMYPPDHYARVAGFYQRAVSEGSRSPTADVGRQWLVSRSTAAKWVMKARADGLIP